MDSDRECGHNPAAREILGSWLDKRDNQHGAFTACKICLKRQLSFIQFDEDTRKTQNTGVVTQ